MLGCPNQLLVPMTCIPGLNAPIKELATEKQPNVIVLMVSLGILVNEQPVKTTVMIGELVYQSHTWPQRLVVHILYLGMP